jgi:hypothetical protein
MGILLEWEKLEYILIGPWEGTINKVQYEDVGEDLKSDIKPEKKGDSLSMV